MPVKELPREPFRIVLTFFYEAKRLVTLECMKLVMVDLFWVFIYKVLSGQKMTETIQPTFSLPFVGVWATQPSIYP